MANESRLAAWAGRQDSDGLKPDLDTPEKVAVKTRVS